MVNAATVSALLLLALAGGFFFAYTWRLTRFLALRLEGQQLIFMAVGFAVPLLFVSRLTLLAAPYIFSEFLVSNVGSAWSTVVKPINVPPLAVFVGAFALGPILGWVFTLFSPKRLTSNFIIDRYGSELEQLLNNAVRKKLLVSVTLDNRKVYIGWTGDTPKITSIRRGKGDDYFTLLPVVSGYRKEDTLRLDYTTDYTGVYELIQNSPIGLNREDFEIVVPLARIVTANLFNLQIGQAMFAIPPVGEVESDNVSAEDRGESAASSG